MRKAKASSAKVEDGEVLRKEDITEDPQGSSGWWHVHSHDADRALALTKEYKLEHILYTLELKQLPTDHEGQCGQLTGLFAWDSRLAFKQAVDRSFGRR